MPAEYLFVYGTLRRGGGMHRLLARSCVFVGMATFQGRLYRIGAYPGAVASANPKHTVVGEVYRLRAPDFLFRRLDRYERCGPGFRQHPGYVREPCTLTLAPGQALRAWIYRYTRPTAGLPPIPSGDFLHRSGRRLKQSPRQERSAAAKDPAFR